jgi:diguanylate cyclase (GGDEF)-like protein
MGGDEFVLILPGLEEASVQAKALQLRDMAETRGSRICGESIVSLSVGEAFYPRDGLDAEQLLAEADRRMYKAKQGARVTTAG